MTRILILAMLSAWTTQAQAQSPPQGPKQREAAKASDVVSQKRFDALQSQMERLAKDVDNLGKLQQQDSADLLQSAGWLSFVAELQERLRVMERTLTDLTGRVELLERYGTKGSASESARQSREARGEKKKISADEQLSEAQRLLREQRVEDAVRAFAAFAKNYPSDPRVAEAMFYLGESYAVLQDDKAAMKIFLEGYKKDRDSTFAPRLLLRLGQTLAKLKRSEQACRVLREYQKRFGDIDPDMTKLAESELLANRCSSS